MTSAHSTNASQQCQNSVLSGVKLMIYHQFPGIELVYPVYACENATCYLSPDQKVDVGFTTQAGFSIDLSQGEPIGILMYELRNEKQSNKDVISSEDEARCIQLLIIWKVNNSKEFYVDPLLIEHDKGRIWDRDKLMRLANRYKVYDIHGFIEETYLMHDNTVLMTRVNVAHEEACYKLEMIISKGSIKYDTQRLVYIDVDR
jgi:hypothetical protein